MFCFFVFFIFKLLNQEKYLIFDIKPSVYNLLRLLLVYLRCHSNRVHTWLVCILQVKVKNVLSKWELF